MEKKEKELKTYVQQIKRLLTKKHASYQKKTWTPSEDQKVMKMHGEGRNWKEIA